MRHLLKHLILYRVGLPAAKRSVAAFACAQSDALKNAGLTLPSAPFSTLRKESLDYSWCLRGLRLEIWLAVVLDGPLGFYPDLLDRENPPGIQISSTQ